MNDKKEVVVMPESAVAQSPMAAMQLALEKNVDLEKIEKMIQLQKEWDAIQAEKAFTIAMTEFKCEAPVITRDKENAQYNSYYTSIGNLVNSCLPKMSECGLSHKWSIEQGEQITVTCIVTHKDGHSEPTSMSGPPDGSGSKNPIQQIKSTVTYLKAATFESAMGLASTDANIDDDGNGAGDEIEYINPKEKQVIADMLADSGSTAEKFLKSMKCETIDKIPSEMYKAATTILVAAKKINGAKNASDPQ